jgi:type IV secretion system protein TrbC
LNIFKRIFNPQKENTMQRKSSLFIIALTMALFAGEAFAGTGTGGLPWEGPLATVAKSLTGPVALSISIIALMVAGGTLVFGGELSEFARRACIVVLAISFLVAGASFLSILFGVSAATVAVVEPTAVMSLVGLA